MKVLWLALLMIAGSTTIAGAESGPADSHGQIIARADAMEFGPCPPAIPFDCGMAVLEGSPATEGLFTMRLRTTEPWVMPPHSHPRHERVTVLSGNISVGFGPVVDKSAGESFAEGDYYVNPPDAIHYVWTEGPVEIQITGMGPWEVHPHRK